MDTEKYYYGLNLDLETTKKDSSNIDCELPGKLPENPSLNTTNTSLLNKASTTNNYKKLDDCPQTFTLTKHNDAITDSSLQVIEQELLQGNISYNYSISTGTNLIIGTKKDVYLGYEDINKMFEGNLSSVMSVFRDTLDSDVTGCSAKLSRNDTTGASIKYSLNKCTADRIITFSYKNTPIFKINQTYYTAPTTPSLLYAVWVYGLTNINSSNTFAWFMDGAPNSFSQGGIQSYLQFPVAADHINKSFLVFWYTDNTKMFADDLTVSNIMRELTHYSGNDNLSNYGSYYYTTFLKSVNVYDISNPTTKKATLSDTVCLYKISGNIYTKIDTVCFGSTSKSYHLGCYKMK